MSQPRKPEAPADSVMGYTPGEDTAPKRGRRKPATAKKPAPTRVPKNAKDVKDAAAKPLTREAKDKAIDKVAKEVETNPAVKRAAKKSTPRKSTAKPKVTTTTFEWPAPGAAKLLLEYLTERCSADYRAPHDKLPFINANGTLHVNPSNWDEWLATKGIQVPTRRAARLVLKDAGLGQRTFQLPGEDFAYGLFIGKAPTGTAKLPRRTVPRGAPAKDQPKA